MGDPRKHRKKYSTPTHPWQKDRIAEESGLIKEFGLKNKTELWKSQSILIKFRDQIKRLAKSNSSQAEVETKQLLDRAISLGLVDDSGSPSDVLSLHVRDILERRLQTQVFKQGYARSMRQARQFITHGHIKVEEKKINVPSHLLRQEKMGKIQFYESSSLSDAEHPERKPPEVKEPKKEEKLEPKEPLKKETKPVKKETKKKEAAVKKQAEKKEAPAKEEKTKPSKEVPAKDEKAKAPAKEEKPKGEDK